MCISFLLTSFVGFGRLDDLVVLTLFVESPSCWLDTPFFVWWKACHGKILYWGLGYLWSLLVGWCLGLCLPGVPTLGLDLPYG